mmetsp:Transcript_25116/g.51174  ORF Transcript_25116/g.51174 Transcript_25116/m.51174 type:complete len:294 (-) Transcript_25116:466-1347(-)
MPQRIRHTLGRGQIPRRRRICPRCGGDSHDENSGPRHPRRRPLLLRLLPPIRPRIRGASQRRIRDPRNRQGRTGTQEEGGGEGREGRGGRGEEEGPGRGGRREIGGDERGAEEEGFEEEGREGGEGEGQGREEGGGGRQRRRRRGRRRRRLHALRHGRRPHPRRPLRLLLLPHRRNLLRRLLRHGVPPLRRSPAQTQDPQGHTRLPPGPNDDPRPRLSDHTSRLQIPRRRRDRHPGVRTEGHADGQVRRRFQIDLRFGGSGGRTVGAPVRPHGPLRSIPGVERRGERQAISHR